MIHLDRSPSPFSSSPSPPPGQHGSAPAQLRQTRLGADERARTELYESLRSIERETPEARVAQAVKPSVVYVETESRTSGPSSASSGR